MDSGRLQKSLSDEIANKLSMAGLSVHTQQKIGTLSVVFAMFENRLEFAVWSLGGESVKGRRPTTDSKPITSLIASLGSGSSHLPKKANKVLGVAAVAATDLSDYRNSLFHGFPVLMGDSAYFVRNHSWKGEVRKRERATAYTEGNIVDMATEVSWWLYQLVLDIPRACQQCEYTLITKHSENVRKAQIFASEIRHIAAQMNNEKS